MASTPEDRKKASQTTAKGAAATTSNAGAGASTAAKTGAKPAAEAATATTPPNKNDLKTDAPPDWEALRAEVARNSPKVKGVQITGRLDLLKLMIKNRDEQASTTYAAHPRDSASQDKSKNNRTVPVPKL